MTVEPFRPPASGDARDTELAFDRLYKMIEELDRQVTVLSAATGVDTGADTGATDETSNQIENLASALGLTLGDLTGSVVVDVQTVADDLADVQTALTALSSTVSGLSSQVTTNTSSISTNTSSITGKVSKTTISTVSTGAIYDFGGVGPTFTIDRADWDGTIQPTIQSAITALQTKINEIIGALA